jgi:hypothetical protein
MNRPDLAPIALFAYNRPDHLARVARALSDNREASMSRLFIFSDAAKNVSTADLVQQVRAIARGIKGFSSVEVVEQRTNQGVANSVIQGVGRLVAQFGKVIVLEDDLLPSPHFLGYVNSALDQYENDNRVISVHAYSYPVEERLPETFFLRGADCWGWGTWKRGWDQFEADGAKLLRELEQRKLTYDFDFNGSYPYTQMLRHCIDGKNDSWAIRWYASAFLLGKLTLYPGSSQVQNIGTDGSGFHVGTTRSFEHQHWGGRTAVTDIPVEESETSRQAFAGYLSGLKPSLLGRTISRVANMLQGKY